MTARPSTLLDAAMTRKRGAPRVRRGDRKPNYALLWRAVAAQDAALTVRLLAQLGASTSDMWEALTGEHRRAVNGKWIARHMATALAPVLRREDRQRRGAASAWRYRRRLLADETARAA